MPRIRLTALLLAAALAGCASFTEKVDSWQGRPLDDLIQAWGPPNDTQLLSGGRRVVTYTSTHTVSGTSYDCRVWFFVGANGRIQNGNGEGSIGGCNRLLGQKKAGNG